MEVVEELEGTEVDVDVFAGALAPAGHLSPSRG